MEDFLDILRRKPAHEDGTVDLQIVPIDTRAVRPQQLVLRPPTNSSHTVSHDEGAVPPSEQDVVHEEIVHEESISKMRRVDSTAKGDPVEKQNPEAAHRKNGAVTAPSTSGRVDSWAVFGGADSSKGARSSTSNGDKDSWSWNGTDGEWGSYPDDWEASESRLLSLAGQGLSIEFTDVHFSYTEERAILHGVSFTAAPGESVAIVGPSGSGKSTILKLLTLLHRPSSGTILINSQDVTTLTRASLRQHVAAVPQDTVLLNDTILENIRYGRRGASDIEVRAASRLAQLDTAIERMPEGYKTAVGERGLKLSGGEKQRVAIARAFLRAPLLLVCDEATSALDTAMEQGILRSLQELAKGRTSVFVAHRLSTVMNCDKIIVLANGVVAETGTHEELMASGGVYAAMWAMQAGKEEVGDPLQMWEGAEGIAVPV
jgi:ABC-type multidrug transport system fused ATPase/permease subunit